METLKGGELVPSGMLIGGVGDDQPEMAGRGTDSVVDMPTVDRLPLPGFAGPQIPVGYPGRQPSTDSSNGTGGSGSFSTISIGGEWKEVS